ncbi:MAG: TIGR03619 family F420-dependent LLM class oxidoreductase [Gammaproteobacteria bacterium]
MQFGTSIPQAVLFEAAARGRHAQIARVLQTMQDAGFSYLQVSDHVADPGMSHHAGEELERAVYGDAFSTLAYLAPLNAALRFVIGVLVLPLRHPVLVAHSTATLDQLTGGRFILGVGSGYARREFGALGVDMRRRFALTEESLQILIALLERRNVSYDGRFHKLDEVTITCPPLTRPRPPIWVGGVGEQAAARAARLADAWFPSITGYARAAGPTPRRLAEMNRTLQALRREAGKPPLPIVASTALAFEFLHHPRPLDAAADVRDRCVNGTGGPEDLADLVNAYHEAGVGTFLLMCHSQDSLDGCLRAVDAFASRVRPRLAA